MLKKFLLLLALVLSGISLSGCSTDQGKLNNLKIEGLDSYVLLNGDDLSYHLASGDDFVLMVSHRGCHGCELAKTFIREYAKETENIVYVIEYEEYSAIQPAQQELPKVSKTPTFLYFKSGDLLKMVEGVASDYASFASQMNKYLLQNELYSLNTYLKVNGESLDYHYLEDKSATSVLDEKLAAVDDLTVFYTWLRCGDCQNFHQKTFDRYISSLDKDIKVYQFEVDYFRKNKPGTNPGVGNEGYDDYMLWLNFAEKYGFAGYRDGKVPVLVNYQDAKFSSMAVFANDSDLSQDVDGKYYYATTFFPEIADIKAGSEAELFKKVEARELELMTEFMDLHIKGIKKSPETSLV